MLKLYYLTTEIITVIGWEHKWEIKPRLQTYFIRSGSHGLVVQLVPLANYVSFNSPVVYKISPDVGSSVLSRCTPAQHHEVLEGLHQSHTSWLSRHGCTETKHFNLDELNIK